MATGDYPRWIYRSDEEGKQIDSRIVQSAYEHSTFYRKGGWTGPPLYGDDIATLKAEIGRDEAILGEKKARLAAMEKDMKDAEELAKRQAAVAAAAARGKGQANK